MGYCDEIGAECQANTTCSECLGVEKKYEPREGYSLTLDEIHFLFAEYLNNYYGDNSLECRRTVREIEELRCWLTNAAISGTRLK